MNTAGPPSPCTDDAGGEPRNLFCLEEKKGTKRPSVTSGSGLIQMIGEPARLNRPKMQLTVEQDSEHGSSGHVCADHGCLKGSPSNRSGRACRNVTNKANSGPSNKPRQQADTRRRQGHCEVDVDDDGGDAADAGSGSGGGASGVGAAAAAIACKEGSYHSTPVIPPPPLQSKPSMADFAAPAITSRVSSLRNLQIEIGDRVMDTNTATTGDRTDGDGDSEMSDYFWQDCGSGSCDELSGSGGGGLKLDSIRSPPSIGRHHSLTRRESQSSFFSDDV